jgi:hypothetical protein
VLVLQQIRRGLAGEAVLVGGTVPHGETLLHEPICVILGL